MTWLYLPSNFSLASACLEKDCVPGSDTWVSRIASSATLSGKLTQPASWRRAWKKEAWMRHLSGPTLPHSLLDRFTEKWTASLPDSLAKTYRSLASAKDSTESEAACSSISHESPTIAVRGACFWRTSQASLLPPPPLWTRKAPPSMPPTPLILDFLKWVQKMDAYSKERPPESWENWPTSGGMRSGSLFQRPTWAPVMAGPVGSASPGVDRWPTPDTMDFGGKPRAEMNGTKHAMSLHHTISTWMTPHGMSGTDHTGKAGAGGEFAKQATQWMTPCVPSGGRLISADLVANKGMTESGQKRTVGLESQTRHWPTPRVGNNGGSGNADRAQDPTNCRLEDSVQFWPTPAARDHKGTNSQEHATVTGGGRKHMDQLANFVAYSPLAQPTRDGETSSTNSLKSLRHLNPLFGGWLMGWTSTWVIAEPHALSASATASFRCLLQSHLSYLLADLDSFDKE